MMNLFKTKIATAKRSDAELVKEIHETFFTEVDRILQEANIIKESSADDKNIEKYEKLRNLGFTSAKTTQKYRKDKTDKDEAEKTNRIRAKVKRAVSYFSKKYPMYKFITEESVQRICNKYGLVYGPVDRYIGEIPDANIEQMVNFKIEDKDKAYFVRDIYARRNVVRIIGHDELDPYRRGYDPHFSYPEECSLEIAAPKKDFNMDGMEVKGVKLSKIDPPDPIVLQPVHRDGEKYYLIVTAWGPEASDHDVVNEKMN